MAGFVSTDVVRSTSLDQILNNNPTLQNTPGLALDVANSGIDGAGDVAAVGVQTQAASAALAEHQATYGSKGVLGSVFGHVLHAAGTGLEWLYKPLQEIQKDYKFLHAVYTNNGLLEGVAATLGVAGGAIAGGFFAGGLGAAAGADAMAALERNTFGRDPLGVWGHDAKAFADSQDPNYKVSFGRDISNLVGLDNTDHGAGKLVSGTADAIFDIGLDPTLVLGKGRAALRGGKWIATTTNGELKGGVAAARHVPGFNDFLGRQSLRVFSPDQVDAVRAAPVMGRGYRRAIDQIAEMSAGDIVARFPELQSAAGDLGRASTADEVHNIFRQAYWDASSRGAILQGTLPSRTLMRVPFSAVAEKLRQSTTTDLASSPNLLIPRSTEAGRIAPVIATPWKTDAWKAAVGKKVRTFSGYMPYNIDKNTLELSQKSFNANDPGALQGVYRTMKFSMGERVARNVTTEFANTSDIGEKKRIWATANVEMLKAAGVPDDSPLMKNAVEEAQKAAFGSDGSEVYGWGSTLGEGVSDVVTQKGTVKLGLGAHQASQEFAYPNFQQVRNAVRSTHAYSNLYGRVEDMAARKYIGSIFKPWALLTAGFGLRVAASEAIPEIMREGAGQYLKARVASSAARMGYSMLHGEDNHVIAAMAKLASGVFGEDPATLTASMNFGAYKLVNGLNHLLNNPDDAELAANLVLRHDGHIVAGINNAGHGTADDPVEFARDGVWYMGNKAATHPLAPTADWTHYDPASQHFDGYWLTQLQKWSQEKSGQLISKDVAENLAKGMPEDEAWKAAARSEELRIRGVDAHGAPLEDDPYAYERSLLARYKLQDPTEFAVHRTDNLRGLLTGKDGTFHNDLALKLANGEKPTAEELAGIESLQKPRQVIGQEMMPRVGPNLMQRITNTGFSKVVTPTINYLSREPMYFNAVRNEMRTLKWAVDAGELDYDTAVRLAEQRATYAMLPQIHNTALRSQFAELARNYLPFYFAQEQALRRAGTLIYRHPAALRQYQLIEHALNNPGFVQTDGNGGRYLMMPYIGEWGMGAVNAMQLVGFNTLGGLPISVRGDMQSLQTVLPELNMPGVSPLVSVALNQLTSVFPELARPTQAVIGDRAFGQGFDALIPSSPVRNILKGVQANDADRSYANAVASSLASAYYHGMMPEANASAAEKQAFMDRVKNNARSIMYVKAILGAVSPLAPQVSAGDMKEIGFRDEFYKLVKEKGDYGKALDAFLAEHGDKAISYTVAQTEPTIKGATQPYTNEALNWLESNQSLINGPHATGAAFLVPQTPGPGNVQAMHDELLKLSLRARRTPQQFMDAIYVAAGNNQISDAKKVHDAAVLQYANNPQMAAAEKQNWSNYIQTMSLWNPVWAEDYQSPQRTQTARRALDDLRQIFAKGLAPDTRQSQLVYDLLQQYEAHRMQLVSYGNTSANAAVRSNLKDQWSQYLDLQAQQTPELAPVIRSVFARLENINNA